MLGYQRSGEGDWNDYYFVKQIEELFNVDLQIEMIGEDVWKEKLPLWFASNDLPDFILCNYGGGGVDTAMYAPQGYLAELSDYVSEETTPNIWKMWEEVPASKATVTLEDGGIYSINGVDNVEIELDYCRYYIREDWAKQILGKLPENTDELYEYLKAVNEHDMDGDGDPNNEIPIGGYYKQSTGINTLTMLRSAFGLTGKWWQVTEDGEVFYTRGVDNYKEMLKYTNKLYTEGLIDQEFFTQTEEQFSGKVHQYGAYGAWGPSNYYSTEEVESKAYRVTAGMPVLTSPVNDTKMWPAYDMKVSGQITVMADCEYIDRVMAIADWLLSEEGFMATVAGPALGASDTYPEYGYTGGLQDYVVVDEEGNTGTFPEEYSTYDDFLYSRRPKLSSVLFYRNWAQIYDENTSLYWQAACTSEVHKDYFFAGYPSSAVLTQAESQELDLLLVDIQSYTQEMESKMILGELDIDAYWDTYMEGLQQRGLDTAIQIKQDAYDRSLNK